MSSNQDYKISLNLIDKYTAPSKKILGMTAKMEDSFKSNHEAVDKINRKLKDIKGFKSLEKQLSKTDKEFKENAAQLANFSRAIKKTSKPTGKLTRDFERAKKKSKNLTDQHRKQKNSLDLLRTGLKGAGVDTRNLASATDVLATKSDKARSKLNGVSNAIKKSRNAQAKYDQRLSRASKSTLVAGGAMMAAQKVQGMFNNPINQMRSVEKAKGNLRSVGVRDTSFTEKIGRDLSKKWAYIDTAEVISAAYDIKSGISNLSDKDVGEFTGMAALTGKATKADSQTMTEVFAKSYGLFKDSNFKNKSDMEFGEIFSGQFAATVKSFKTNGANLSQAVGSMGGGLSLAGVEMSEQLSALGMLQKTLKPEEAGTALKNLSQNAAKAQKKLGSETRILNDDGNMLPLAKILENLRGTYGDEYTTELGGELKEIFGSAEAVKFFENMWGKEDQLRKFTKDLKIAGKAGIKFVEGMTTDQDKNNGDSAIQKMSQSWNNISSTMGKAFLPILQKIMPLFETGAEYLEKFINSNSSAVTVVVAAVAGIALLTAVIAPLVIAVNVMSVAAGWAAKSLSMMGGGGSMSGDMMGGGGRGRRSKILRGRGRMGRMGRGMRLGGIAAAAGLGAMSIYDTVTDENSTAGEKAEQIGGTMGSIGGGIGGMKLGAMAGAFAGPIGIAVGGALGGILGSIFGGGIGSFFGGLFKKKPKEGIKESVQQVVQKKNTRVAAASAAPTPRIKNIPSPTVPLVYRPAPTNPAPIYITVNPSEGMDELRLAGAVKKEMENLQDEKHIRANSSFSDDF